MGPNLIGQTLSKYRILEEIGRGGMGVVYKAHDTVLDRLVAIKVLAPHLTWDQEFVQRFLREARTAARLEHTHIVMIYDVGQAQGYHFIAMKYLEGQPLSTLIRQEGPLHAERAVRILVQIAQALDYAHARRLVHRDVKPGNVIVGPQDQATLTDFGVARSVEGTRLTQSGVTMGTPAYMAPEQVKGEPVGPATDVYALGVVAYEMLSGQPPFKGDTPHVLHAHVYEEPRQLPRVNPKISPTMAAIVQKALVKEPGQRYRSAGAFAAALRQAIGAPTPPSPPEPSAGRALLGSFLGVIGSLLLLVVLAFGIGRLRGGLAISTPTVEVTGRPVVVETPQRVTPKPTTPMTRPMPTLIRVTNTPVPTRPAKPTDTLTSPVPTPALSEMVLIPAGILIQGSTVEEVNDAYESCTRVDSPTLCWRSALDDEVPRHEVYLDEFYIDKYEVTNAQYGECVKAGVCGPPSPMSSNTHSSYFHNPMYADCPVIYVNWHDADGYCRWTGKRLPTEAEWEKAARGSTGMLWPWGDFFAPERANLRPGGVPPDTADTARVGSYPAGTSPHGVTDMVGNVWEWVADWYDESYYQVSPSRNPRGPASGEKKVIRGGSWNSNIGSARAASRAGAPPDGRYFDVGFRCAR